RSLEALAAERRPIELLEHAVDELVHLSAGARRRLGIHGADGPPTSGHGVWALGIAIERAAADDSRSGLELALETLADSLRAELPPIFASVTPRILRPLLERPREGRPRHRARARRAVRRARRARLHARGGGRTPGGETLERGAARARTRRARAGAGRLRPVGAPCAARLRDRALRRARGVAQW